MIAGHKGQSGGGENQGRQGRRRRLKGKAGRGTLEKERPPVFGMMERGGQVVINLLANVKQRPSSPLIKDTIMLARLFLQTNTAFMLACMSGDTSIRVSIMGGEFARDDDETACAKSM